MFIHVIICMIQCFYIYILCIHAYIHTYIYIQVFIDVNVNIPIGAHDISTTSDFYAALSALVYMCTHININIIYINMYIHVIVYMYFHVNIYTHAPIHVNTEIHVYCIYICSFLTISDFYTVLSLCVYV
jgi:hypothetical protein